ncbi:MAG: RluA family pseudouridine synthase [Pyramidobacter sp.]|nr:RluA family pseudouridine synthase [Pyramidobacter sp.]
MSYQFQISRHDDGRRIDAVLRGMWPGVPLGGMMKHFRKGEVRLEGKRAEPNARVCEGQFVWVPWEAPGTVGRAELPEGGLRRLPLEVIYKDEHVLVINKPAGLLSQPDTKGEDSVVTRATFHASDPEYPPQLVHRLDRNTSGVMILSLDGPTTRALMEAFKVHTTDKRYWAIVTGELPEHGRVDAPLLKDAEKKLVRVDPRGERAVTEYKYLTGNGDFSLAEVHLLTGRTHQIRVHMNHIGHPLLGDVKYGDFGTKGQLKSLGVRRPMLHARSLTLTRLPDFLSYLEGTAFRAPAPDDLCRVMERLGFIDPGVRP